MGIGENRIYFDISDDGQFLYKPEYFVQSTSLEIQPMIHEIAEKGAEYMGKLLREALKEMGVEVKFLSSMIADALIQEVQP